MPGLWSSALGDIERPQRLVVGAKRGGGSSACAVSVAAAQHRVGSVRERFETMAVEPSEIGEPRQQLGVEAVIVGVDV